MTLSSITLHIRVIGRRDPLYGGVLVRAATLNLNINTHRLRYCFGSIGGLSARNYFQKTKGYIDTHLDRVSVPPRPYRYVTVIVYGRQESATCDN